MGAGTSIARRIAALSLLGSLSLCAAAGLFLRAPEEVADGAVELNQARLESSFRLAVLFDRPVKVHDRLIGNAATRSDIERALSTSLQPFVTEEQPTQWPRQRILSAVYVRGVYENFEGLELYANMRLRRGPGELLAGFSGPVRIRLIKRHQHLVVVSLDRPRDGRAPWHDDTRGIFPDWVRQRVLESDNPRLIAEVERLSRESGWYTDKPKPPTESADDKLAAAPDGQTQ